MTLSEVVTSLHTALGTWRAVAQECGAERSAAYYRAVALGEIKRTGAAQRRGILAAAQDVLGVDVTAVTWPGKRAARYAVMVRHDLGLRLAAAKNARELTWDGLTQMVLDMLEKGVW